MRTVTSKSSGPLVPLGNKQADGRFQVVKRWHVSCKQKSIEARAIYGDTVFSVDDKAAIPDDLFSGTRRITGVPQVDGTNLQTAGFGDFQ